MVIRSALFVYAHTAWPVTPPVVSAASRRIRRVVGKHFLSDAPALCGTPHTDKAPENDRNTELPPR